MNCQTCACFFWILGITLGAVAFGQDSDKIAPRIEVLQPGVQLTLLAEHPDLVTPTGIAVDDQGHIWLVACHTHFRPDSYTGPENDEILTFNRDGSNRRLFYNRTRATMQLMLGPEGWVYLAQRDRILRVKDSDGDGVGDQEEILASLDTLADYPHNGLSGMAWHTDGGLIFSLGENFGKDWTLTAKDGSSLKGRGEGGVFHFTADGRQLRRIARGFWNPFGLLVRNDGLIFAAENDPGSRPPCRLLHVVEGADYGFQYVYGSAPVHPFVAWNGELRGTLGMVHPCGEGPCSVVALGGGVMIPSWSNHCVDYFPLRWNGASLTSERIELVRGSDFFRPVCLAPGPEGEFYFTDWVSPSYELHGFGRLWRMDVDAKAAHWLQAENDPPTDAARVADSLRRGIDLPKPSLLFAWARGQDKYLADAALSALAKISSDWTAESLHALSPADRVWALVALRRVDLEDPRWVRAMWSDPEPEIRFECLRWIADSVFTEFQPDIEAMLVRSDIEYRLFEAAIAALNTLKGNPAAGVTDPEQMVSKLLDPATPAKVKSYALRLTPVDHPSMTAAVLLDLMREGVPELSLEAVRTLALRSDAEGTEAMVRIASEDSQSEAIRAEAIAGLMGRVAASHRDELEKMRQSPSSAVRKEIARVLREPTTLNEEDTDKISVDDLLARLDSLPGQPDPNAGRRLFFHSGAISCSRCHRYEGRGKVVGPDLSLISQQGDRRQILQSLLAPNQEVAPQFYATYLELDNDSNFTGILLRSSSNEVYRNNEGDEVTFQKSDIVTRRELRSSLMPSGLVSQFTDAELRDLLAFLMQ